jgi:hypothetical protein
MTLLRFDSTRCGCKNLLVLCGDEIVNVLMISIVWQRGTKREMMEEFRARMRIGRKAFIYDAVPGCVPGSSIGWVFRAGAGKETWKDAS